MAKTRFENVDIRKVKQLKDIRNDMTACYYHLVHINANVNKDLSYPMMFVLHTEYQDIQEYLDIDSFTKEDLKVYIEEITYCITSAYSNLEDLWDMCKKSVVEYNL